jgi:hypothetical protein
LAELWESRAEEDAAFQQHSFAAHYAD